MGWRGLGTATLMMLALTGSARAGADEPASSPPTFTPTVPDAGTVGVIGSAGNAGSTTGWTPPPPGPSLPPSTSNGTASSSPNSTDGSGFGQSPALTCIGAIGSSGLSPAQALTNPVIQQLCGLGSSGSPAPSTADAAVYAWEQLVALPSPTLAVQPGYAVTGRLAFLQISGPQTFAWSGTALGVEVTIDATSTYDIDWGDGSPPTTGVSDQGGPWPDGDITHVYTQAGSVVISVTQRWTAQWSAGAQSGTLTGLLHTTGNLALTVDEIQANRD